MCFRSKLSKHQSIYSPCIVAFPSLSPPYPPQKQPELPPHSDPSTLSSFRLFLFPTHKIRYMFPILNPHLINNRIEDITIIFLPFIQNKTMETHHLSHLLTPMRKILSRGAPKTPISPANGNNDPLIAKAAVEFVSSVQQKVWSVKTQLCEILQQKGLSEDGEPLSRIEINLLKMTMSKLSLLNREPLFLFQEGALTLYQDFCGLIKSCSQDKIREAIRGLLKQIGQRLKNLLLQHFIYQQYLSRKQKREGRPQFHNNFLQQQGTNIGARQTHEDSALIQQIERQVLRTPIPQLIEKQVRNYQKKMKEASEVCRICFNKVLMRNVEQHVKECQKRNILKQNIEEKKYELTHLKCTLKQKCEEINLKDTMTEHDEEFKKLARIILSFDKNDKYVNRRCSLNAGRSDRHIVDIKKLILEFLENYEENQLLIKIEKAYREKTNFERQINQIEMNSFHAKLISSTEEKQNSTGHSSVKLSNFSIKTKTTHEKIKEKEGKTATKKQQSHERPSNNSLDLTDSEHSDKQIDKPQFQIRREKRCLSKHLHVNQDYEPLDNIKQYSSLQAIIEDNDIKEISLDNFQILKVLGQGAFGKVYLVRRKQTKDIYALKIIKIPQNNTESSIQSIKRQHQIFKKIAGEHLVKAPFSFSEKNCHIFILEYLPGGDLRRMLNEQVYFEQERAKAYLAEIVLAIEHLHVFNIIHRDLKPQNLVFDKTGHLKLTDFGLSQFQMKEKLQKSRKQEVEKQTKKTRKRREAVLSNNKQKMKLIGTPDYIAPEIIFKTSLNNFSIDWWSLGVMAYELIIGTRPFCAQTIEEVIDNITNFNIDWPEIGYQEGMISPEAKDLICQLLNKDFMHRLGAQGAQSIKEHPFFASICWETIKSQKPIAIPKITNLKECMEFKQDLALKKQMDQFMQKGEKKRAVDLQKFVRFDLLGTETIQTFQKVHEEQKKKLRTLKSLQQNFVVEDFQ